MAKANSKPSIVREVTDSTNFIKQAFGYHDEDVIEPIKTGANALGWLDEICRIIREETRKEHPDIFRIRHLADAGSYLAEDLSNYCGSRHEEMVDNLVKAGIRIGGAA